MSQLLGTLHKTAPKGDAIQPTTTGNGRLWDFAAGPARNTTPVRAKRSKPKLAALAIVVAAVGAIAGVACFVFAWTTSLNVPASVSAGALLGGSAAFFVLGTVIAGERLAHFLIGGTRAVSRGVHVATIWIASAATLLGMALLFVATIDPAQHNGLPAVVVLAGFGAITAEIAVLTTPALVSTNSRNGLLSGTFSVVLFFAAIYLGITALIFAYARNGISQNIPTAIAIFVLLAGWVWAIHRDGVKRQEEFEDATTGLILALREGGQEREMAALRLESAIVRQERRQFASTPPPLSDPLRATLFHSLNALTGATPFELSGAQQEFFAWALPPATIERADLDAFLRRLRQRTLLGASGLRIRDARRDEAERSAEEERGAVGWHLSNDPA